MAVNERKGDTKSRGQGGKESPCWQSDISVGNGRMWEWKNGCIVCVGGASQQVGFKFSFFLFLSWERLECTVLESTQCMWVAVSHSYRYSLYFYFLEFSAF